MENVIENWIVNQFKKGQTNSFKNFDIAEKYFNDVTHQNLIISQDELDQFVEMHLSEAGQKKLKTTIKVARKRANDKAKNNSKLEVTLTRDINIALMRLVKNSGLTKTEIISQLIEKEANPDLISPKHDS